MKKEYFLLGKNQNKTQTKQQQKKLILVVSDFSLSVDADMCHCCQGLGEI